MTDGGGRGALGAAALTALGLVAAAALLGQALGAGAVRFKEYERTVVVKGLSEREVPADVVIWPISFMVADNDLGRLYETLDRHAATIRAFLNERGIPDDAVTVAPPAVTDKLAQQYGGPPAEFRYVANQSVTVYSRDVDGVRRAMGGLAGLGRSGIALSAAGAAGGTEYLFTGLNGIKPEMVEEATTKGREVAQKFAQDSGSRVGRIRRARQGQFSISDRDRNNPHIKKVRVVSTLEYYLAD